MSRAISVNEWLDLKVKLAAAEARAAELERVLLMVEYMTTGDNEPLYCPWCGTVDYNGHTTDCPRQKALGL